MDIMHTGWCLTQPGRKKKKEQKMFQILDSTKALYQLCLAGNSARIRKSTKKNYNTQKAVEKGHRSLLPLPPFCF